MNGFFEVWHQHHDQYATYSVDLETVPTLRKTNWCGRRNRLQQRLFRKERRERPVFIKVRHDSWREWGLDKEMVTSVTIPPSVTRIGRNAFVKFSLLTAVAIPTSVTSLGSAANGPASLMMRSGAHTRTMVVGGGASSPLYSSFVSSAITFPASSPQVEAPSTTFTSPVVLPAAGLMMTAANAPHLANARALMSVVEAEIVTLSKELHRSKAPSPMLDTEVGMSALINEQHSLKAP